MNVKNIKKKLESHPVLKKRLLNLMVHPVKARPRRWMFLLRFLYIHRGRGCRIYGSVRKDVVPFNAIVVGMRSVVEQHCTLNNMCGDIVIGDGCHIGLYNTLIGPVRMGNGVITAQNITISGLNHGLQNVETAEIVLQDDIWIGSNSVVLPGVTIGKHSIVGAGSVVTHSIPPFSVAVGNPARVIKHYDFTEKKWIKSE
jgi:acetyltransferase-like isoleucine patch superfamily enzyme